jgi:hypothetical protein
MVNAMSHSNVTNTRSSHSATSALVHRYSTCMSPTAGVLSLGPRLKGWWTLVGFNLEEYEDIRIAPAKTQSANQEVLLGPNPHMSIFVYFLYSFTFLEQITYHMIVSMAFEKILICSKNSAQHALGRPSEFIFLF